MPVIGAYQIRSAWLTCQLTGSRQRSTERLEGRAGKAAEMGFKLDETENWNAGSQSQGQGKLDVTVWEAGGFQLVCMSHSTSQQFSA